MNCATSMRYLSSQGITSCYTDDPPIDGAEEGIYIVGFSDSEMKKACSYMASQLKDYENGTFCYSYPIVEPTELQLLMTNKVPPPNSSITIYLKSDIGVKNLTTFPANQTTEKDLKEWCDEINDIKMDDYFVKHKYFVLNKLLWDAKKEQEKCNKNATLSLLDGLGSLSCSNLSIDTSDVSIAPTINAGFTDVVNSEDLSGGGLGEESLTTDIDLSVLSGF